MKATGIVRRIDDLGRIVVPKEIRIHALLQKRTTRLLVLSRVEMTEEEDSFIILW